MWLSGVQNSLLFAPSPAQDERVSRFFEVEERFGILFARHAAALVVEESLLQDLDHVLDTAPVLAVFVCGPMLEDDLDEGRLDRAGAPVQAPMGFHVF
jgi:hypothetical protein